MQAQPADTNPSTEFQCPQCGAQGFEVLATQRYPDADDPAQELGHLVIRCLICLHTFEHPLRRAEHEVLFPEVSQVAC